MMRLSENSIVFLNGVLFFILSLVVGCSGPTTIGKKYHQFGNKADQIIWIQVAGLTEEHLGLVKFNLPIESKETSLEQSLCLGKLWSYNLYDLRVKAEHGFISQMTGSKNIKNNCEDYERNFLWNYLEEYGFDTSILENNGHDNQSIDNAFNCEKAKRNFAKTTIWLMKKSIDGKGNSFHFQSNDPLQDGVFFDKSCQGKGCYATLSNNAKALWKKMNEKPGQKLLIIRDFSFLEALVKKDITLARERLSEITQLHTYFKEYSLKSNKILLLVSTSASLPIEYPNEGREWNDFLKKGKNIMYKKTSLLSSVWADGAGAENFCSFLDENEILDRILWGPEGNTIGIF